MLIGQASFNLTANVLSALLGLASVFVFTRLFSPHNYGVYLLGVGFASVVSVVLVSWFRMRRSTAWPRHISSARMRPGSAASHPTCRILAASVGAAVSPIAFRTMTTRGAGATAEHMADSFDLLLVVIGPVAICSRFADQVLRARSWDQLAASRIAFVANAGICAFFGAITNYCVHVSFQWRSDPFCIW
jgi:hypothetical protein